LPLGAWDLQAAVATDRVPKFTYVEFHDSAGKKEGAPF
jgi:hypothetical protein